jgi:hypothetical protein
MTNAEGSVSNAIVGEFRYSSLFGDSILRFVISNRDLQSRLKQAIIA